MEPQNFSKTELLNDLKIEKQGDDKTPYFITKVKLINSVVKIILTETHDKEIDLYGYYKGENEHRIGAARCALYFLLLHMIDIGEWTRDQKITVSSPTPDDGNMNRLIKIYKEIGFILGSPEPGNPINLNSTVGKLIDSLETQCNNTAGKKTKRRKKMKKKKKRKTQKGGGMKEIINGAENIIQKFFASISSGFTFIFDGSTPEDIKNKLKGDLNNVKNKLEKQISEEK